MKKVLAVIGIVLPFVFGMLWIVSFALLTSAVGEPTSKIIFLSYLKMVGMIGTLVGLVTLVIGLVYLGREKGLTHKEILKHAWKLTRKNIRKFLLGILLLFFLKIIQNGLSEPNQPMTVVVAVLMILLGIAYTWIDLGLKSMSLSLAEDKTIRAMDVFVDGKKFLKYIGAYILVWIFTVAGSILLIVPGVYVSLRLNMMPYLILEKNLGPWAAIKESRKITKGKVSNLFALDVLLGFINVLGFLLLLVGLFWTLPLFYIANAIFYKKLLTHKK